MKMKQITICMLILLLVSAYVYSETKVGVVNANEIMMKTKKGNTIRAKIEAMQKEKQQQGLALQEEIKKLQQALASPALNAETRDSKTEELNQKEISLKRFAEDSQNELERAFQKELYDMEQLIMPVIQEIGKSKGFTVILDMQKGGLVYFDATIDITADVIQAFDAKYAQ